MSDDSLKRKVEEFDNKLTQLFALYVEINRRLSCVCVNGKTEELKNILRVIAGGKSKDEIGD
jgi:hypothetical protein